jgi:hypothetical protein
MACVEKAVKFGLNRRAEDVSQATRLSSRAQPVGDTTAGHRTIRSNDERTVKISSVAPQIYRFPPNLRRGDNLPHHTLGRQPEDRVSVVS